MVCATVPYAVSRAKDWVSVDCGTNTFSCKCYFKNVLCLLCLTYSRKETSGLKFLKLSKKAYR